MRYYTVSSAPKLYKSKEGAFKAALELTSGRKHVKEWILKEGKKKLLWDTLERFPSFKTWLMSHCDLVCIYGKEKYRSEFKVIRKVKI